jgi:hypothetical protein
MRGIFFEKKQSYNSEFNFPCANKDEIPSKVYEVFDWTKTVVGGSYALNMYTCPKWESNDVDVMIKTTNRDDFNTEVNRIVAGTNATIIKQRWGIDKYLPIQPDQEAFNKKVLGTCTLKVENINKPIQLIAIETDNKTLLSTLNEITDKPACISYTIEDGKKMFHVPEKCAEVLFTKKASKTDICQSRIIKYTERNYQFE